MGQELSAIILVEDLRRERSELLMEGEQCCEIGQRKKGYICQYLETSTPIPPDGAIRTETHLERKSKALNSSPLELIYGDEDPATYLHYNETRITPYLLLVSSDISEPTQRKIIDDPGFGHKPVIASVTINSKSTTPKMPTKVLWKLKKADWPKFTNLLETEINASSINYNQHPDKLWTNIINIIIKCAKKTIPHGKVKHHRVFWSKNLEELKRQMEVLCNTAEQTGKQKTYKSGDDCRLS
nr:hypothetical protein HmN_000159500 [Hymenolepis microstoma]